jgi:hypothetical protein
MSCRYAMALSLAILCACHRQPHSVAGSTSTTASEAASTMATSSGASFSTLETRFPTARALESDGSPSVPSEWIPADQIPRQVLPDPKLKKRLMDKFSWETFIALSWPVSSKESANESSSAVSCDEPNKEMNGSPWEPRPEFPTQSQITVDNCPRWMTWHKRSEVLQGFPPTAASRCEDDTEARRSPLDVTSKIGFHDFPDVLTNATVPSSMNSPLIDQNGNKVYYDILINDSAYRELKCFKEKANAPIPKLLDFQSGENSPPNVQPGATELKLAWKVLDSEKDRERRKQFIIRTVRIPDDNNKNNLIKDCGANLGSCSWRKVDVGLVGIHIVHKSKDHSQWIWSSFEQVDNDPNESASNATPGTNAESKFSFFGDCPTCPHNSIPTEGAKSQLTRTEEIAPDTAELNHEEQQMLKQKGSVLQYYELIGTQYDPINTKQPGANATPSLLRNTVIEPYIETSGKTPSCIGCHSGAIVQKSCCGLTERGKPCFADFSFLVGRIDCAAH